MEFSKRIAVIAGIATWGCVALGVVAALLTVAFVPDAPVDMTMVWAWTSFGVLLAALTTVLALILVVPTFKRLGWGYGVYTLLVIGIPAVSSKDFQGLGRYVIAAFPLFLTVAQLIDPRPRLRMGLLVLFALLLATLAMALGAGGYVS